jgi:hypothetical protein
MIEPRVDPLDFIESAIPQCGCHADLVFVHDELVNMNRDIQLDALHALAEEDDRDERAEIVDYLVMYQQQLAATHRRFIVARLKLRK